ncbi:MAG: HEPN domain-containing protein [Candidatus Brocadiae bacterium]|nr:HEPN domain-containing protein [Candidatus Brocadiia bacterium]
MREQAGPSELEQWLTIARRDWQRIRLHLGDDDALAAGFFLQQSIEKYFKAFLLSRGWELRKIHALDALLDDAVTLDRRLERFYPVCERVTDYYMLQRYPPLALAEPSLERVRRDMAEAESLVLALFPLEEVGS